MVKAVVVEDLAHCFFLFELIFIIKDMKRFLSFNEKLHAVSFKEKLHVRWVT